MQKTGSKNCACTVYMMTLTWLFSIVLVFWLFWHLLKDFCVFLCVWIDPVLIQSKLVNSFINLILRNSPALLQLFILHSVKPGGHGKELGWPVYCITSLTLPPSQSWQLHYCYWLLLFLSLFSSTSWNNTTGTEVL